VLAANGQIDGPGSLLKVGLGTLTFGGSVGNTLLGEVIVNQGALLLNKPTAVTAVPERLRLVLWMTALLHCGNLNSYQIVGNIYVHSRGIYDINGQQENTDALVMYGNATVRTGGGYLSLKTGAPIFVYPDPTPPRPSTAVFSWIRATMW